MWERRWSSANYRVIAYSRRYNFPNNNPHSTRSFSHHRSGGAAFIKGKLGRVHIVGHSYGAFTALFSYQAPRNDSHLVWRPPVLRWAEDPEGRALFDEFMDNVWKPVGDTFGVVKSRRSD
jgi:hypothetical protein